MSSALFLSNSIPHSIFVSKVLGSSFHFKNAFFTAEYPYFWIRLLGILLTSLVLSLVFSKLSVSWFAKWQVKQNVREEGPKRHYVKNGTPTMGGAGLLLAVLLSVLFWGDWNSVYLKFILSSLILFGFIGFLDDFIKIKFKKTGGLKARYKYLMQSVFALLLISLGHYYNILPRNIFVPFLHNYNIIEASKVASGSGLNVLNIFGLLLMGLWQYIVIVGASNAVNLTDGLDGLVSVPVLLVALGLGIFAYFQSSIGLAHMVHLPYISGSSEVILILLAILGACLGFLWFNTYPAQIFMGDVGALALGAGLGMTALILSAEIVFAVMGFLFVIEALSVIIQVASYKIRRKRVFRMAPIHHHFELKGWEEPKICVRFWCLSGFFLLLSLVVLL